MQPVPDRRVERSRDIDATRAATLRPGPAVPSHKPDSPALRPRSGSSIFFHAPTSAMTTFSAAKASRSRGSGPVGGRCRRAIGGAVTEPAMLPGQLAGSSDFRRAGPPSRIARGARAGTRGADRQRSEKRTATDARAQHGGSDPRATLAPQGGPSAGKAWYKPSIGS